MAGWTKLEGLVHEEITQREKEGCTVTGWRERFQQLPKDDASLMHFYQELSALPADPVLTKNEPNSWEEIQATRPRATEKYPLPTSEAVLKDKFQGAWLARCVGCALGKPIEAGAFMGGQDGRPGWKNVELWFRGADAWPIQGYTPGTSRATQEFGIDLNTWSDKSKRENLKFMESDDDIRYMVIALGLMEEKGLDWTSFDLGKYWHGHLPYRSVCTAETQAYLNFAQVTDHYQPQAPSDWPEKLEWVRNYLNPYREFIGAQIRVDGYAYAAAGNPHLAANLAWRDASFSHVRNGIYGSMFLGAAISAAFSLTDPEAIIQAGLDEIPAQCRLTTDIHRAVDIAKKAKNQLDLAEKVWDAFSHYNPVHTNNNAALCAASFVFAQNDFEQAITTSVLGWDTDCNGASVGSLIGAVLGAKNIPQKWSAPLNDTLYSEIPNFHPIKISECAERSYALFQKHGRES